MIFKLILLVFVLVIAMDAYVKNSVKDKIISADEALNLNADCILVLGAGVRADGSPSPMLEDRLLQGTALYQMGASGKILMSGDNTRKGYDEVNTMKQYALDEGIVSEDVFMDHVGISTYDSIYRAKEIFQADKIIIVTQKYHLYRALYISDSLGLDAYGVSANPRIYAFLGETIPVSGDGNITNDRE